MHKQPDFSFPLRLAAAATIVEIVGTAAVAAAAAQTEDEDQEDDIVASAATEHVVTSFPVAYTAIIWHPAERVQGFKRFHFFLLRETAHPMHTASRAITAASARIFGLAIPVFGNPRPSPVFSRKGLAVVCSSSTPPPSWSI